MRLHETLTVGDSEAPEIDGSRVLITELADGAPADTLRRAAGRPLPDALRTVSGICEGLAHLHGAGRVRGHLKPANVPRTHDGPVRLGTSAPRPNTRSHRAGARCVGVRGREADAEHGGLAHDADHLEPQLVDAPFAPASHVRSMKPAAYSDGPVMVISHPPSEENCDVIIGAVSMTAWSPTSVTVIRPTPDRSGTGIVAPRVTRTSQRPSRHRSVCVPSAGSGSVGAGEGPADVGVGDGPADVGAAEGDVRDAGVVRPALPELSELSDPHDTRTAAKAANSAARTRGPRVSGRERSGAAEGRRIMRTAKPTRRGTGPEAARHVRVSDSRRRRCYRMVVTAL